jgi:hypothetical protein
MLKFAKYMDFLKDASLYTWNDLIYNKQGSDHSQSNLPKAGNHVFNSTYCSHYWGLFTIRFSTKLLRHQPLFTYT